MRYLLAFFFLTFTTSAWTQQAPSKKASTELKEVSVELEIAIKSSEKNTLAKLLVKSAELYKEQGNFAKSEEYYKKAIEEYQKLNNQTEVARLTRELALIQESQDKKSEAIFNYKKSKVASKSENVKTKIEVLNDNDIKRLEGTKSENSKSDEKELIQSNIEINKQIPNNAEVQQGYMNLGKKQLEDKDNKGAIESFEKVYQNSIGNSASTRNKILDKESPINTKLAQEANQKIAEIYKQENKLDKAIEIKKQLLKEPLIDQNLVLKIAETQNLASFYVQNNETETALDLLKKSYQLSMKNHLTIEAKSSLERISEIYKARQETSLSIPYYENFLSELQNLIDHDSNLYQKVVIKETEDKISQLIKEKELQEQLIDKKNTFNYFLLGFIILLLVLLGFILYTLKAIKKKNLKIELQSLRREMNPHFIFNSLNSINQFIAQKDELSANSYLTKFSILMRGVMENSKDDFITLDKEIKVLDNYIQLEKNRFSDKFNFELIVDEKLTETDEITIPSMLIQPFIENAIWHGLRYVSIIGWLNVRFDLESNEIKVTIEDNGVGIEKSKELKTKHQSQHKGRGMSNTEERIKLLNELYHMKIRYTIEDKQGLEKGVKVTIFFPNRH